MSKLYLSKVIIDPQKCPLGMYPHNLWKCHSLVYRLFGKFDGERILWADESARLGKSMGGSKYFLILSSVLPTVPENYQAWLSLNSTPIEDSFLSHSQYAFLLQANCTRSAVNSQNKVAIVDESELGAWLARKLKEGGCQLIDYELMDRRAVKVMHDQKKHQADPQHGVITLNSCRFKGRLQVLDSEAFKELFSKGLGRAKAYGFGMLQIVPIKE